MNLASIEADVRNEIEKIVTSARTIVETHLPKLAQEAEAVASDPLAQALEAFLLPADVRQMLAGLVTRLGTAKESAATIGEPDPATVEETAQAADVPSVPPGPPAGPPAGPIVAGVA